MGNNGRGMRGDNQEWRSGDRNREFDDREEGNRWGDHPHHDRQMQNQRDRYATGQSGYSAGRSGEDPSLNYQNRNAAYSRDTREDRQAFGTDDRFTGRGGDMDYSRGREPRQTSYGFGYGDRNYDQAFGGPGDQSMGRGIYDHREDDRSFRSRDYGPSESERGIWSMNMQRSDRDVRDSRMGQMGQGEHRGKGPRGYMRSDERIKENVCEALTDDPHIDASSIDIEVKNGEVTLSGTVSDRRTKRMAEDLIERLSGVKDVMNQLKVSDDERQRMGSSRQSGNQNGNGVVAHEDTRKADDKKARA